MSGTGGLGPPNNTEWHGPLERVGWDGIGLWAGRVGWDGIGRWAGRVGWDGAGRVDGHPDYRHRDAS